jgi:hypothetical protein
LSRRDEQDRGDGEREAIALVMPRVLAVNGTPVYQL